MKQTTQTATKNGASWRLGHNRCLKSLFSAVACNECGGNLTVAFGEKMGYSREIRLACEVCVLLFILFFTFFPPPFIPHEFTIF